MPVPLTLQTASVAATATVVATVAVAAGRKSTRKRKTAQKLSAAQIENGKCITARLNGIDVGEGTRLSYSRKIKHFKLSSCTSSGQRADQNAPGRSKKEGRT